MIDHIALNKIATTVFIASVASTTVILLLLLLLYAVNSQNCPQKRLQYIHR